MSFRRLHALGLTIACVALWFTLTYRAPAQTVADPQFNQAVAELSQSYGMAAKATDRSLIQKFTSLQLETFLYQPNGYLRAAAILTMKERTHRAPHDYIGKLFRETPLASAELRFDPHAVLSPDASVFLASAEYLATLDRSAFSNELFRRRETWSAPHWFVPVVSSIGSGWIRVASQGARDHWQLGPLSYLIANAATPENVPELQEILRQSDGLAWEGAARACERLNLEPCWQALEESIAGHPGVTQLIARRIQFRNGRVSKDILFQAAQRTQIEASLEVDAYALSKMWVELYQLARQCTAESIILPSSLSESLRATGPPPLLEAILKNESGTPW